ncbi:hypothetical protein LUZ60_006643 [Juncus effusus]|nr:hypothetical protein LUZ60_006643 [Juncus effusus]
MASKREEVCDGSINPLLVDTKRHKNSRKQISLNKDDRDYISDMSDDILIKILSLLDFKAVIFTGILSRRWKNLFRFSTHFNLTLEFPHSRHDVKMTHFTKIIQNLLGPNANLNIRSLLIELKYFRANHKPLLDVCVLNAFNRKLEHFELLVNKNGFGNRYKFSLDGLGDSLQNLHLSGCDVPHLGYHAFRSLKKLTLTDVAFYDIEDFGKGRKEFHDLIQKRFHLLINGCLNLEILSLIRCFWNGVMRIDAPLSHIKKINCIECYSTEIEIFCAPRLESLDIYKCRLGVDAEPNPSVKYFRFGFYCIVRTYRLDQISSVVPCLQTLVLCFEGEKVWLQPVRCSVSFMKLKRLIIEAKMSKICNPLWIALILEAAPFLETFEINFKTDRFPGYIKVVGKQPEPFNFQHKNLKEFKVRGFEGGPMEKKLVRYVMERATTLEKIILSNNEGYYEKFDATKFDATKLMFLQ